MFINMCVCMCVHPCACWVLGILVQTAFLSWIRGNTITRVQHGLLLEYEHYHKSHMPSEEGSHTVVGVMVILAKSPPRSFSFLSVK